MISEDSRVFPGVRFGKKPTVQPYCVIGLPTASGSDPKETIIGHSAVIRTQTVIYAGNTIGDRFQTGHGAKIRENNRIGDDVSIGTLSVVEHSVEIGDRVRIHSQAFVPEHSVLGPDSWIGPNAVLTNARYPQSPGVKSRIRGPTLEERAIIGANATILPGLTIGARSLVGAGSVVVNDVPAGVVVAGNPAKILREVDY